ncbi:MAG: hypothetical protein EHM21_08505 [Chloroflexi bacterium]|nr:MAG: hypothetical protein EHM21_08505 [Chloroflexota bacterium]
MKLIGPDSSFYLTILGYQHPDAAGEPYDANWLSIHIEAVGPDPLHPGRKGAWTGTDPCLLTYEVGWLADWLQAIGGSASRNGNPPAPAISFLEPVLLFRVVEIGEHRLLRVHFGNLINPSWRVFSGERPHTSPDLWLDFPLDQAGLAGVASAGTELREEVRRYPDRAKDR